MAWALVVLSIVPDSPTSPGRFFKSSEERMLLLARLEANKTGKDQTRFKWSQAKEASMDIKIWLFMLMGCGIEAIIRQRIQRLTGRIIGPPLTYATEALPPLGPGSSAHSATRRFKPSFC